jgi:hypothetical protein
MGDRTNASGARRLASGGCDAGFFVEVTDLGARGVQTRLSIYPRGRGGECSTGVAFRPRERYGRCLEAEAPCDWGCARGRVLMDPNGEHRAGSSSNIRRFPPCRRSTKPPIIVSALFPVLFDTRKAGWVTGAGKRIRIWMVQGSDREVGCGRSRDTD